jgi:hypothetical protein
LTEQERKQLMEEQYRIMAQIENETRASTQAIANAQADAFDQGSANPVLSMSVLLPFMDKKRHGLPLPMELPLLQTVFVVRLVCK